MGLDNILLIPGVGGGPTPPALLLDTYPATNALSFRKLRTAYTGNCCRVRRASDNAELDIGFSSGSRDDAALSAFCAGTDGFMTTWYDQQGSSDGSQAVLIRQPKIYDASSGPVLKNGNPSSIYNGTAYRFDFPIAVTQPNMYFIVCSLTNPPVVSSSDIFDAPSPDRQLFDSSGVEMRLFAGSVFSTGLFPSSDELSIFSPLFNNTNSSCAINDSAVSVGNAGSLNAANLVLGNSSSSFMLGYISEIVVYDSDESVNRTSIVTNQNTYYGAY